MNYLKRMGFLAGSFAVLLGAGSALQAATATDHFNDYGTAQKDLFGNTGSETSGWAGPWATNASPDYYPDVRLVYNDPNYDNTPNQAGDSHGAAGVIDGGGVNSSQAATRSFSAPLTGTVWISALSSYTEPGADTIFWLDKTINTQNFIALRSGVPKMRFGNVNSEATATFANATTHLMLAKLELNVSGDNDAISFWVNPDLSGGEAGLPTPHLTASSADAYGLALDDIGVAFAFDNSYFDAIRVSNDADGFEQVIPEPASLTLLAVGGLLALRRRR